MLLSVALLLSLKHKLFSSAALISVRHLSSSGTFKSGAKIRLRAKVFGNGYATSRGLNELSVNKIGRSSPLAIKSRGILYSSDSNFSGSINSILLACGLGED